MIWLVIAAALVVALIFGASLAIVAMASVAVGVLFLLLLVFDVIALIWVSLGVLAVYTVIESGQRTTLWFIGLGLLGSLVILLDRNRTHLEPLQANPQTGAPRPRRWAPQSLPPEFFAAPADGGMSEPAPVSAAAATNIDQAVQQPEPVPAEIGAEAPAPPQRGTVQQTEDGWPFIDEGPSSVIGALARAAFAFLRFRPRRTVRRG